VTDERERGDGDCGDQAQHSEPCQGSPAADPGPARRALCTAGGLLEKSDPIAELLQPGLALDQVWVRHGLPPLGVACVPLHRRPPGHSVASGTSLAPTLDRALARSDTGV
jgi:hypothetical protein